MCFVRWRLILGLGFFLRGSAIPPEEPPSQVPAPLPAPDLSPFPQIIIGPQPAPLPTPYNNVTLPTPSLEPVCITMFDVCCTTEHQCSEGEGDCDSDDECKGDLVCPQNENCAYVWGLNQFESEDCCTASNETIVWSNFELLVEESNPHIFIKQNLSQLNLCGVTSSEHQPTQVTIEIWLTIETLSEDVWDVFELQYGHTDLFPMCPDCDESFQGNEADFRWFRLGIEWVGGEFLWVLDSVGLETPVYSDSEVITNERMQLAVTMNAETNELALLIDGIEQVPAHLDIIPSISGCIVINETPSPYFNLTVEYLIIYRTRLDIQTLVEHFYDFFDDYPACMGTGIDTCCAIERPCAEGHGDCDSDEECEGDLICPFNDNCKYLWGLESITTQDCCAKLTSISECVADFEPPTRGSSPGPSLESLPLHSIDECMTHCCEYGNECFAIMYHDNGTCYALGRTSNRNYEQSETSVVADKISELTPYEQVVADDMPLLFMKIPTPDTRLCNLHEIDEDRLSAMTVELVLNTREIQFPDDSVEFLTVFELQDPSTGYQLRIVPDGNQSDFVWALHLARDTALISQVQVERHTSSTIALLFDADNNRATLMINGVMIKEGVLSKFPDTSFCYSIGIHGGKQLIVDYTIIYEKLLTEKDLVEHFVYLQDEDCDVEQYSCPVNGVVTCLPTTTTCNGADDCDAGYLGPEDERDCLDFPKVECMGRQLCCSKDNPCPEGEGDCDTDEQCEGDLICPQNDNCYRFWGLDTIDAEDCCISPFDTEETAEPGNFTIDRSSFESLADAQSKLFIRRNFSRIKICKFYGIDRALFEISVELWVIVNRMPQEDKTELPVFALREDDTPGDYSYWMGIKQIEGKYFWVFSAPPDVLPGGILTSKTEAQFGEITQIAFTMDIDEATDFQEEKRSTFLYVNGKVQDQGHLDNFPDMSACMIVGDIPADMTVQYLVLYEQDIPDLTVRGHYEAYIDGSCPRTHFPCPVNNSLICLPFELQCNGKLDCDEGYDGPHDEQDCTVCSCSTKSCSDVSTGPVPDVDACGVVVDQDEDRDCVFLDTLLHHDAVVHCESKELRLCTVFELLDNLASSTGCGFDTQPVWSSTFGHGCKPGEYWTAPGNIQRTDIAPIRCTPTYDVQTKVRCCADKDLGRCCLNNEFGDVGYESGLISDNATVVIPHITQEVTYRYDPHYNYPTFGLDFWANCNPSLPLMDRTVTVISSADFDNYSGYYVTLDSEGGSYNWRCYVGVGGFFFSVASTTYDDVKCFHVACAYDGSKLVLYVNNTATDPADIPFVPNTDAPLKIGEVVDQTRYFNIELFALYEHLSSDTVTDHYALHDEMYTSPPQTPGVLPQTDEPWEDTTFGRDVLIGITVVWFTGVLVLYFYGLWRYEEAKNIEIIWVGVASYDLFTDILFAVERFSAVENSPYILGIISVTSIVASICVNTYLVAYLFKTISTSSKMLDWYSENSGGFSVVMVLAATNVETFKILCSGVFEYPLFSANFSPSLKVRIGWFGVAGHILEDIPHVVLQSIGLVFESSTNPTRKLIVVLALVSSCLALVVGLTKRCGLMYVQRRRRFIMSSFELGTTAQNSNTNAISIMPGMTISKTPELAGPHRFTV